MYLPAFSVIARDLHTDVARIGLTLTSFFIGVCIGQLAWGPILDRYGRKKPLIFGVLLYSAASLGCAFSTSLDTLIWLRLLLALGGSVSLVASRAVVRDLFSGNEIARALSMVMMVFGIAPVIAPAAGGMVVHSLGWRGIFGVLSGIGIFALAGAKLFLPESKGADARISLRPGKVLSEYINVFRERQFTAQALASGALTGGLFTYLTGCSFVLSDLFGFTATQAGWIFAANAGALMFSNYLNRMLLRKQDSAHVLRFFTAIQLALAVVLLAGTFAGIFPRSVALGLIGLYMFCFGVAAPNATALALRPFSQTVGSASAAIGAIQMLSGVVASVLLSLLHNRTAVPMSLMMTAWSAIALTLVVVRPLFATTAPGD
jgi:DHA1 family bicyclomycin/chloramphenicol resistance-like MFS transporter